MKTEKSELEIFLDTKPNITEIRLRKNYDAFSGHSPYITEISYMDMNWPKEFYGDSLYSLGINPT